MAMHYRIFFAESTPGTTVAGSVATTGAADEAHAEEAHHANGFWYGDKNELIWGSLAFLIVLAVFLWKGLPAVRKAYAKRTQRIADEIAAAEAKKADADRSLASLKGELGRADDAAKRIVADAGKEAAQIKADLIARAEADAAETKQRARIEVDAWKGQSLADLKQEVTRLTVAATEELVQSNLNAKTQTDLIELYIRSVEAQGARR